MIRMSNWINVDFAMPIVGARVLFSTAGGFVGEGYVDFNGAWCRYNEYDIKSTLGEVVAWMQMPKYKEVKNER